MNEDLLFYQYMTPLSFEIPANDSVKLIFDFFVPVTKLSHSSDIWTDTITIFNNSKNNSAQDITVLSDIILGNIDDNNVSINFKLVQNYPNPFNPTTKIIYTIPSSENVEIKIFDVLGNEIINLVNEYKSAGTYEIEFDGNNLSSGIYFYRIVSGKYFETKKMLLLK